MKVIDLRSDTVTKPTEEMRKAIYDAAVGDDVYGDDPTVNELEEFAAKLVGKEAALFVPSGTFGNQVCIMTHTNRGDEVILESHAHIKRYEVGAAAVLSGVILHTIDGINGQMNINDIKDAVRGDNIHYPSTRLICLENANGSGKVFDLDYMEQVYELAKKFDLKVHLDGARLFNAATFLNVESKEICKYVDSVTFCLSKGLAAPIGSIVAGSKEFIAKARKNRKLMGGGMRQVGIIAAAGLVSLKKMIHRLNEDHDNARLFADLISGLNGVEVFYERLNINMVFCNIDSKIINEDYFVNELKKQNILVNGYRSGEEVRFAFHNDISREDVYTAFEAIKEIFKSVK